LLARRGNYFWLQAVLLAVLLPMALLAKSTNVTLLPVIAAALAIGIWRREIRPAQALGAAALILGLGAVLTGSYFYFNLRHFGVLTPMQETVMNQQAHRHVLHILTAMPLRFWLRTTTTLWVFQALWIGGWSFLRMPHIPMDFYIGILFLSAVSLAAGVLTRRGRSRLPIDWPRLLIMLLVLACVECGLMYHAAESYSAWSGVIATNPWYAALAIPWWLIVLAAGVWTLPWTWVRLALLWAMPMVCLIAELYGLLVRMIPFYSATSLGEKALRRLAMLHPTGMGMSALSIAAVIEAGLLILLTALACKRS